MKILVAAICIGLQIISAQTTEPASIAVTGEPPEGKTPPRELWVRENRGILRSFVTNFSRSPWLLPISIIGEPWSVNGPRNPLTDSRLAQAASGYLWRHLRFALASKPCQKQEKVKLYKSGIPIKDSPRVTSAERYPGSTLIAGQ